MPERNLIQDSSVPRTAEPITAPIINCAIVPTTISERAVEIRSHIESRLAINARPSQSAARVHTPVMVDPLLRQRFECGTQVVERGCSIPRANGFIDEEAGEGYEENRIRCTHDKPRPRLLRGRSHQPHGGFGGLHPLHYIHDSEKERRCKRASPDSGRHRVRSPSHGRQPPPLALTCPPCCQANSLVPRSAPPAIVRRIRFSRAGAFSPTRSRCPFWAKTPKPYSRRPGKIPPAAGCAYSSRRGAASPRRQRSGRSKRARGRSWCSALGSTLSPTAWIRSGTCACSRSIIPRRKLRNADGSRRPTSRRRH